MRVNFGNKKTEQNACKCLAKMAQMERKLEDLYSIVGKVVKALEAPHQSKWWHYAVSDQSF